MSPSSQEPSCKYHEEIPALAVCSDCGADVCGACHGYDRRGLALCPTCRGVSQSELPPWECTPADYTPRGYIRTLWQILRYPRTFFEGFRADGKWLPALLFGFVSMTVGLLIDRVWKFAMDPEFISTLNELTASQPLAPEQMRILVFLTTPLTVLLAGALHIGALKTAISIAGESCEWRTATRLGGYSLGAYLMLILPPVYGLSVGHFLAVLWLFNLEASALQRFYGFGPWKSTFTVMLPVLLVLTCGG